MGKRSDRRAEAEKRDRLLHLLLIIMTIYDQWMMGISGGGEKEGDAVPALDMRACEAAWAKRQLARVYRRMAECFELLGYHGRYCLNAGQFRSVNEKVAAMNECLRRHVSGAAGELHELVACTRVLSFMLSALVQTTHESRRSVLMLDRVFSTFADHWFPNDVAMAQAVVNIYADSCVRMLGVKI